MPTGPAGSDLKAVTVEASSGTEARARVRVRVTVEPGSGSESRDWLPRGSAVEVLRTPLCKILSFSGTVVTLQLARPACDKDSESESDPSPSEPANLKFMMS